MKKQITLLALVIAFTSVLISCKKDDESVKARVTGRWSIQKIEVSGYTTADTQADPTKVNTIINGTSGDYMDFKADNDDQVELSIKGNRNIGNYVIVDNRLNISFSEGNYYSTVTALTMNQLQFTAKLDKTNVVKIYYLTR